MEADPAPAFSVLGDIALYCPDTHTEKHAMFVLSFGAGGQADGLHSCFHIIKPVTLEVTWSVLLPWSPSLAGQG